MEAEGMRKGWREKATMKMAVTMMQARDWMAARVWEPSWVVVGRGTVFAELRAGWPGGREVEGEARSFGKLPTSSAASPWPRRTGCRGASRIRVPC